MPWNDICWLDFRIAPFWWQIKHMNLFVRITLFIFFTRVGHVCRQICWLYITSYYSYKRKTSFFNRMCECSQTIRNFGLHSLLHADTCITYKCLRLLLCIEKIGSGIVIVSSRSNRKLVCRFMMSCDEQLWASLIFPFSTRSNNDIWFMWT